MFKRSCSLSHSFKHALKILAIAAAEFYTKSHIGQYINGQGERNLFELYDMFLLFSRSWLPRAASHVVPYSIRTSGAG